SLLEITLTQPVLLLRLQVADRAGRPVEISDTFYRADRCRYESDLSAREPAAAKLTRATVRRRRSPAGGRACPRACPGADCLRTRWTGRTRPWRGSCVPRRVVSGRPSI